MEYEKLYNEALERARNLHKDAIDMDENIRAKQCEIIFTELKESEEEKVKRILHSISSKISFHLRNIFTEEEFQCFDTWSNDWLEKQSNTIPDECVFRPVAGCDIELAAKQAIKQQGVLAKKIVLAFNGAYIPVGGKAVDIIVNEYNSWLGKKGEQKVSYTTTVETGDGGINALVTRDIEIPFGAKDSELQEATYFIPKGYYAKIEGDKVVIKKGEQKPFNYENANIQQKDFAPQEDVPRYNIGDVLCDKSYIKLNKGTQSNFKITDIRNGLYICDKCSFPISQQDEYELVAKKVEPKFKVGDWIINRTDATIMQIVNNVDFYESVEIGGQRRTDTYNYVEWDFRLWAIQDAKDGDAVVDKSDGTIGIFQSIGHRPDGGSYNDPSYCFLHCRYDDGFFYADFEHGNTIDSDDLIPATKEQRDFLFQKMKEAGYEWDEEKKELKHDGSE